jgi:hypothetical protein
MVKSHQDLRFVVAHQDCCISRGDGSTKFGVTLSFSALKVSIAVDS